MTSEKELNELRGIWQSVMQSFTETMPEFTVELWFAPRELKSFDGSTVVFATDYTPNIVTIANG